MIEEFDEDDDSPSKIKDLRDFPGGTMVKNPPATAGSRFNPWSKISTASEQPGQHHNH